MFAFPYPEKCEHIVADRAWVPLEKVLALSTDAMPGRQACCEHGAYALAQVSGSTPEAPVYLGYRFQVKHRFRLPSQTVCGSRLTSFNGAKEGCFLPRRKFRDLHVLPELRIGVIANGRSRDIIAYVRRIREF
jgi:hypothetical protein